ncbi:ABC transporter permease [Janibacter endophyticus]|uniref:ABC transporter permease n=1 Tax=Janibacter endophyticus TaxID=2806261 RepID=UPI001F264AD9|nr:ABC transporter permease [Janibacter endophyticus]
MTTINPTFTRLELKRIFRDPVGLFFTAVLPAFMYVIFGATQSYKDESAGNGNVAMWIMVSMAAYGAVTATTSIGGLAAVEKMQGWGRQLGLTPMRDSTFVASKAATALIVAAIPIALIYGIGLLTGAKGETRAWVLSGLIVLAGGAVFALYGLAVGLAFRSENAVGAASGALVILAFLGNVFVPLSGTMLDIARFTPLYGYVSLARRPLTEGYLITQQGAAPELEPLWVSVTNLAVWGVVFAVVAVLLVRRGRGRQ